MRPPACAAPRPSDPRSTVSAASDTSGRKPAPSPGSAPASPCRTHPGSPADVSGLKGTGVRAVHGCL